ncbi:prolyl oligopeptidase family serine peptidase [Rhodanobacter sp. AS-Z3]|uniref:alpha/beta hydrolase family protein n=1 Tax=Rhodanobacter sp. AS-Z3 TaxID=3031330 RepID=UPI00247AC2D0|nr:prolyl oligopeptidase family serine peptidase [Rhodanobacter sp. AS-Z3]WEN16320.1 prolyl oligopeptidase family serine peptidase [Rhodanobacter sp. AS-Z3]
MTFRFARTLLSAACLLLPAAILAADRIPVEDFVHHAQLSMPTLSPDGKHLAVNMTFADGSSHALAVYDVSDMSRPVSLLRLPKYELAIGIVWASNTRLVVDKGRQVGSIDQPAATGEVIATDFDGKNQDYLYGPETRFSSRAGTRGTDRGWGFADGAPTPSNGHFYLTTYSWDSNDYSTLYDVDTSKNSRRLVGQIKVPGMQFMIGADGKAHYAYGQTDDWEYVVYRQQGNSWMKMSAAETGSSFTPLFLTPDRQHIYARHAVDGDPDRLIVQDENGGNRKVLASDSFGSIGTIEDTPYPYQPFATTLATGVPQFTYIDANSAPAKLHRALSLKFPGSHVHFIDFSENGGTLLFSVSSDRNPGSYFLIDTTNYKVTKLFDSQPLIDPAKMAERRPLRFKASNGTELEAILTIPTGANLTKLPMVLVPHGGPINVADHWGFDDDAQFLASRGYLVLQVNYRGSSGRGGNFKAAGYHQWGTGIQQDLIDAVKWAIAENYADPQRICIYGASFGGYSAMMAPIRAPGMFKCAVGYAGIYDMGMRYTKGDTQESKAGRNALRIQMGDDPAELAANSPVNLASKIDLPVFLIHGEDDQRAPFAQAKAMRAALDAAHKPYEWMSKPGEGHGFYSEENNIERYNKLQAFLKKYIGPGVPVAP